MRLVDVVDGMQSAQRKLRRDARFELERRLEKEPLQRSSVLVVVGGFSRRRIRPAERAHFTAVNGNRGAENRAVIRELPVAHRLLEQQLETIAGLQVAVEVDLPAEDLGEVQRELDVLTGVFDRADERRPLAVEPRVDRGDLRLLLVRDDLRVEHVGTVAVGADDAKEAIGIDLIFELAQEAVERADQAIRTPGADLSWIEHAAGRRDGTRDQLLAQLAAAQQAVERRVARHGRFDGLGFAGKVHVGAYRPRCRLRRRARDQTQGSAYQVRRPSPGQYAAQFT